MPNEIYTFLKENNLTQKSEEDFIKEYSNPEKAKELHTFLVENKLTTKNESEFYDTYFSQKKNSNGTGGGSSGTPESTSNGANQLPETITPLPPDYGVMREQGQQKVEAAKPVAEHIDVLKINPEIEQKLKAEEKKAEENSLGISLKYTASPKTFVQKAIERGTLTGQQANELTVVRDNKTVDFEKLAEIQRRMQQVQGSGAYQRFGQAQTLEQAYDALSEDPVGVLSELTLESLAAMVSHGMVRIPVATGTGAAAGSIVPGIGTASGAGTGAIVGVGLTSLNLEYSSEILSAMQEAGVDVTNAEALKNAFSDDTKFAEMRENALKKGVPVALFDMLSAGVAGRIVSKPAKGIIKKTGQLLAETGVQAALGMAGETAGELAAGQKLNPAAILAEGLGELGGGAPEIAIGTIVHKTKTGQQANPVEFLDAAVSKKEGVDIGETVDMYASSGQITPEQAENIKQNVAQYDEVLAKVPDAFTPVQTKKAAELIIEKGQIEKSIEGKDEALITPQKQRIEEIDKELTNIANEPVPEPVVKAEEIKVSPEQVTAIQETAKSLPKFKGMWAYVYDALTSDNPENVQEAIKTISDQIKSDENSVRTQLGDEIVDVIKGPETKISEPAISENEQKLKEETEVTNDSENVTGVSGEIRERKELVKTEPIESTSPQEIGDSGILQDTSEEVVTTPEEEQAAHEEHDKIESEIRDFAKEKGIEISEDDLGDLATLKSANEDMTTEEVVNTYIENKPEFEKNYTSPDNIGPAMQAIEQAKQSKKSVREKTLAAEKAAKEHGVAGEKAIFIDNNFSDIVGKLKKIKDANGQPILKVKC